MDYSNLDVVITFSPSKGIFSPRTRIIVQIAEESNVQFNTNYQLSVIARSCQNAYKDAPNCTVEQTFKFNLTQTHFNGLASRKFGEHLHQKMQNDSIQESIFSSMI